MRFALRPVVNGDCCGKGKLTTNNGKRCGEANARPQAAVPSRQRKPTTTPRYAAACRQQTGEALSPRQSVVDPSFAEEAPVGRSAGTPFTRCFGLRRHPEPVEGSPAGRSASTPFTRCLGLRRHPASVEGSTAGWPAFTSFARRAGHCRHPELVEGSLVGHPASTPFTR